MEKFTIPVCLISKIILFVELDVLDWNSCSIQDQWSEVEGFFNLKAGIHICA
jgi:hypothetical protein